MHSNRRICVWISIIITLLSISGCHKNENEDTVKLREAKAEQDDLKETKQKEKTKEKSEENQAAGEVLVHVCGQVQSPGVYRLKTGSRIFEALEAAGGILETAAGEALNQAETLTDGEQIYVPAKEEAALAAQISSKDTDVSADGKVNINTATKEELMTLNGIGDSRAESIMRYREERGGFTAIEELKEIEGIKDGIFNKLKDQVKVG